MSDLPRGWAWATLGEMGTWVGGGTPSKRNSSFWEGGTVPWLSPKDMGDSVLKGTQDHITEAAVAGSATSLVPANSVVIVVRSGILERTVPIALVPFETALNQDMKAIAPHSGVDSRWLLYTLQSQLGVILDTCRKDGTTVASLDTGKLKALSIPLPPLAEQRRIVEALEDHLSRLDAAEATLNKSNARAAALAKSLPDPASPEFEFPQYPLKELLREPLRNGHSGRVTRAEGGIRAVTLSAVTNSEFSDRYSKLTDSPVEKAAGLWLSAGDIFIQRSNTPELVGTSALYCGPDGWAIFPDLLIRVRVDRERVLPEYMSEVLRSERVRKFFRSQARGLAGSMPKISQKVIENVVVPLPSPTEQATWVASASDTREQLVRLDNSISAIRSRSAVLRRSLLRAAFNGDLVDQDPNDEPADVALARLRDVPTPRRKRVAKRAVTTSTED